MVVSIGLPVPGLAHHPSEDRTLDLLWTFDWEIGQMSDIIPIGEPT
jgi:hypothetical protein